MNLTRLHSLNIQSITGIIFISLMMFVGGDLLSLKIGGFTFRLVSLVAIFAVFHWIIISRRSLCFHVPTFALLLLLVIASVISIYESYDQTRTIAYTLWLIFICLVIIPYIYSIAREYDSRVIVDCWLLAYKIQALLLISELFIRLAVDQSGIFERPHLWFYEPSYAAIYFSSYFSYALYLVLAKPGSSKKDLVLSLTALLCLASATAIFALTFGIVLATMFSRRGHWLIIRIVTILFIFWLILYLFFSDFILYRLLFGFLPTDGFDALDILNGIADRGGNRMARLMFGLDAFSKHSLFGIGFGADQTYTTVAAIPDASAEYMKPWMDSLENNTFINPFIEAFATMGYLGGLMFTGLVLQICVTFRRAIKSDSLSPESVGMIIGLIAMFLVLQFEGNFLRFYVWSTFALALGLVSKDVRSRELVRS